jgi:hypothetical protein
MDHQEILENRIIPDTAKENIELFYADPVSGVAVSDIKKIEADLDSDEEDSEISAQLTAAEQVKIKKERKSRKRVSGPNNSITNF